MDYLLIQDFSVLLIASSVVRIAALLHILRRGGSWFNLEALLFLLKYLNSYYAVLYVNYSVVIFKSKYYVVDTELQAKVNKTSYNLKNWRNF